MGFGCIALGFPHGFFFFFFFRVFQKKTFLNIGLLYQHPPVGVSSDRWFLSIQKPTYKAPQPEGLGFYFLFFFEIQLVTSCGFE